MFSGSILPLPIPSLSLVPNFAAVVAIVTASSGRVSIIFLSLRSGFGASLPASIAWFSPLVRATISSLRLRASSAMAAIPGTSGLFIPERASSISLRARSRSSLWRSASDVFLKDEAGEVVSGVDGDWTPKQDGINTDLSEGMGVFVTQDNQLHTRSSGDDGLGRGLTVIISVELSVTAVADAARKEASLRACKACTGITVNTTSLMACCRTHQLSYNNGYPMVSIHISDVHTPNAPLSNTCIQSQNTNLTSPPFLIIHS